MRRFKVKLEGFSEIFERLVFRGALTGNVDFQALCDVPVALTPDGRGERSLHVIIVSHLKKRFCLSAHPTINPARPTDS